MFLVKQNGQFKEPNKLFYKVDSNWRGVANIYESNTLHKLNVIDTTRLEYDKVSTALASRVKIIKNRLDLYLESPNPNSIELDKYQADLREYEVYQKYLKIIRLEQIIKTQKLFQNTSILEYSKKIASTNSKLKTIINQFKSDIQLDTYRVLKISDNVPNQKSKPKERLDVVINALLDTQNNVYTDGIQNRVFNINGFSYRLYKNWDYSNTDYKDLSINSLYRNYDDKLEILNSNKGIHKRINSTVVDPENGYKVLVQDLSFKDFLKEINSQAIAGSNIATTLLTTVSIQQKHIIKNLKSIKEIIQWLNLKEHDDLYKQFIVRKDGWIIPDLTNPPGSKIDRKVYADVLNNNEVIKKEFPLLKAFYEFLGLNPSDSNIIDEDIIKEIDDYIKDNNQFPDDKNDYKDQYDNIKDTETKIEDQKDIIEDVKDTNDKNNQNIDDDKIDEVIDDLDKTKDKDKEFHENNPDDSIILDPEEDGWKNTFSASKTYRFKNNELVTIDSNAFVAIIQALEFSTFNYELLVYLNESFTGDSYQPKFYVITLEETDTHQFSITLDGNIKLDAQLVNIINQLEYEQFELDPTWQGSIGFDGVNDKIINVVETSQEPTIIDSVISIDAPHPEINVAGDSETYFMLPTQLVNIDCETYTTPYKTYLVQWAQDQVSNVVTNYDNNNAFTYTTKISTQDRLKQNNDNIISFIESYSTTVNNINNIPSDEIVYQIHPGVKKEDYTQEYKDKLSNYYNFSAKSKNGIPREEVLGENLFYTFRELNINRDNDPVVSFIEAIPHIVNKDGETNQLDLFMYSSFVDTEFRNNNGYSSISKGIVNTGLDSKFSLIGSTLNIWTNDTYVINDVNDIYSSKTDLQDFKFQDSNTTQPADLNSYSFNNGYSQITSQSKIISNETPGSSWNTWNSLKIMEIEKEENIVPILNEYNSIYTSSKQLAKNNKSYIISTRLDGGIFDPNNPNQNESMVKINELYDTESSNGTDKVNFVSTDGTKNISASKYKVSEDPSYTKSSTTLRLNVWVNNEAVNFVKS